MSPLFNGRNIKIPGAYAKTDASNLISTTLAPGGIIGMVGTAEGGEANKVYHFTDSVSAKEVFRGGNLYDAMETAWLQGAQDIYATRIGNPTKGFSTISSDSSGSNVIAVIESQDWGSWVNSLTFKFTNPSNIGGSVHGFEMYINDATGTTVEHYINLDNIGDLVTALSGTNSQYLQVSSTQTYVASAFPYIGASTITYTMSGGADGLTTVLEDWTDGLDQFKLYDINLINPAGAIDPIIHSACLQHCIEMSDNQKFRICVVGGDETENVGDVINPSSDPTSHIGRAYTLNHERAIYVAPGVATSAGTKNGAYTASMVAGKLAGADSATSLTFKSLTNISTVNQRFSQTETEDLLTRGVVVVEPGPNGFRVVRDVTTRQDTDPGISENPFKDITTLRIADYVNTNVKNVLEATYIGKKGLSSAKSAMQSTVATILTRLMEPGNEIITNFRNITVSQDSLNPKVFNVSYDIVPVFSITFIFITTRLNNI